MMAEKRGFVSPHPDAVKQGALAQFDSSWQTYSSASAAAVSIAKAWGVGRTTLIGWLKDADLWPTATMGEVRKLRAENVALRAELHRLQQQEKQ